MFRHKYNCKRVLDNICDRKKSIAYDPRFRFHRSRSDRIWSGRIGSGGFQDFTDRVGSGLPDPTRPDPRSLTRPVNSPGNFPFAMARLLKLANLGLDFTGSGPRSANPLTPSSYGCTHFDRGKNDSSYACSSLMDRYPVPSNWTRMTRPVTPPAMGMFTSGSLSGKYTE